MTSAFDDDGFAVMADLLPDIELARIATGTSRRRVLHFLFGPRALPCGLAWAHAPVH